MATKKPHFPTHTGGQKEIKKTYEKLVELYKTNLDRMRVKIAKLYEKYGKAGILTYDEMSRYGRLDKFLKEIRTDYNLLASQRQRVLESGFKRGSAKAYDDIFYKAKNLTDARLPYKKFDKDIKNTITDIDGTGLPIKDTFINANSKTITNGSRAFTNPIVNNGASANVLFNSMTDFFNADLGGMVTILKTQGTKVINQATQTSLDYAFSNITVSDNLDIVWRHDAPAQPRSGHLAMDGQIKYSLTKDGFKNPITGNTASSPGSFGKASEDMNCLCYLDVVEKGAKKKAVKQPVTKPITKPIDIEKPTIKPIAPEVPSKTFIPANTIENARLYSKNKFGVNIENKGLNLEALNTINRAVFDLDRQFKHSLKEFGATNKGNTWASANAYQMNFNNKFFNNKSLFQKGLDNSIMGGFHPGGCNTIKSVIDHEFGHVLTNKALFRKDSVSGKLKRIKARYTRTINKIKKKYDISYVWDDGHVSLNRGLPLGKDSDIVKAFRKEYDKVFISEYCKKNLAEFTAESFSMALNNKNASPFAKEVYNVIKGAYGK